MDTCSIWKNVWLRPFWVLADSNTSLQGNKKPALQWVTSGGFLPFTFVVELQRKVGKEGRKVVLPLVLPEHLSGWWKLLGEALLLEACIDAFS